MKALVTGATGFIGRRLVDRLLSAGWRVTALVRSPAARFPAGVAIARGDVCEEGSLVPACEDVDVVFHLAGLITFDPARLGDLMRVNGRGTENVLRAARASRVRRCVVVSSACTLGVSRGPSVLVEDCVPSPEQVAANPYMASKIAAEEAAAAADCDVVVVCPTTVFGPGDSAMNSGTLFAAVARLPVVPTPPGGTNVVDVDDVVDGLLAAAARGVRGRKYVLGGENLLFAEVFAAIAAAIGRPRLFVPVPRVARFPAAFAARAAGHLTGGRFLTPQIVSDLFAFKYFSSDRARREFGWTPAYTFAETARRAWGFYRREGLL